MSSIENVSAMSVNEYCDFLVTRAMHVCVSPFELNIQCVEEGLISWDRYEEAKAEMQFRNDECFWLERGEVIMRGGAS